MKNRIMILFTLTLMGMAMSVSAADLGTVGATYPIAERDLLEKIQDFIKKTDWTQKQATIRNKAVNYIENYHPKDLKDLPVATRNDSFSVDMTWTLPQDIPDGKGGLIYPKGFTFNPLAHVYYMNTLVFIDASDKRQVDWLAASPFLKKADAKILLTGGSYYDIMKKYKRAMFYANRQIVDRLGLRAVPSVVVQQGTKMVVYEYAPEISQQASKGGKQ